MEAAGWQVVKLSGKSNNGSQAGVFTLNSNNASSNINQNISGHLSCFKKSTIMTTLALAKT